jgi:hypothetical protein
MSTYVRIERPPPAERPEGLAGYMESVAGDDAWAELSAQPAEVERRFGALTDVRAMHRYAPNKWSVKQVLGHLCDSERIYSYRALRFARGDETPLPSFDEDLYAVTGRFDARAIADVVAELRLLRTATLSLFATLDEESLARSGSARGIRVTVRGLAWVTAGHARHHLDVLRDRYGV